VLLEWRGSALQTLLGYQAGADVETVTAQGDVDQHAFDRSATRSDGRERAFKTHATASAAETYVDPRRSVLLSDDDTVLYGVLFERWARSAGR
jgi:hypothetical protein